MPHSQLDEAGRAISTASASTIKSAISSIARALVSLKRLASGGTGAATEAAVSQAVTEAEQRLVEARNVAEWFEADIHRDFTLEADGMFGNGCITRDERIALSGAIGAALDAFRTSLTASAPALYQRDLWVEPDDGGGDMGMDEAATVQDVQASELIPLTEGAVRKDGTALIKLIQPGWGSSGYYPAAVLERDGPTVFKTGTKMFWNHPTATEEVERPEGSLDSLAGQLVEDARYLPSGPAGPGLYALSQVAAAYRPAVDDLASYIGTSIRAAGKAQMGEAEGKKGPIIQQLVAAHSVDYVTTPGAGGQVVQLFEAARARAHPPTQETSMPDEMTMSEAAVAVRGLQEQNRQLQAELLSQRAVSYRDTKITALGLPTAIASRVRESVGTAAPTVEGQPLTLDTKAFDKLIEAAANREILYAQTLAPSGVITGMGGGSGWGERQAEPTLEELRARTAGLYERLGLSESNAKTAAARH